MTATTNHNGNRPRNPPGDTGAEAAYIGACLIPRVTGGVISTPEQFAVATPLPAHAITAGRDHGLSPGDFYKAAHGHIWSTICDLVDQAIVPDPITVADHLDRQHLLDAAGGLEHLTELVAGASGTNAASYVRIIAAHARARRLISIGADIHELGYGADITVGETRAAELLATIGANPAADTRNRLIDGAAFLLDQPDTITALWGSGDTVLWAEGEACMIVGPSGIGKTTLCQQVILGRLGIRNTTLGQPVQPGNQRVLYLAMDRPRQAARSMRRMVTEDDRTLLEEYLTFWKGPLPFDVVADHRALARFAIQHAADTIVIDSLKDICHNLNDDESASKTNAAIQECIAHGVEVMDLHHQRKRVAGTKKTDAPKSLDEVYGNVWLSAGQGSVILIWGEAGDPIVELTHLKPPAEPVGPWSLRMNFDEGHTTIEEEVSVLGIVNNSTRGATVQLVAQIVFKRDQPTRNEIEKARRKLDRYATQGLIYRAESPTDGGGKPTCLYYPMAHGKEF